MTKTSCAAVFSRKAVNVVIHTCDKCVFQAQVGAAEQLLKGWFPKGLKFGPHVVKQVRAADVPKSKKCSEAGCMMCTSREDCWVCMGDKSNDFDIFVDGVLLHSRKAKGHGFLGFAGVGQREREAMVLRQASLRQAIAELLDGSAPAMENEAEVEYKARMAAEDQQLEEEMAAQRAAKLVEKEAQQATHAKWEAKMAELESAQDGEKTAPKGKPKPKSAICREMPLGEAEELVDIGQQQLMLRGEGVAVKGAPWFSAFCCRHSEVLADDPSGRDREDTPLQVF